MKHWKASLLLKLIDLAAKALKSWLTDGRDKEKQKSKDKVAKAFSHAEAIKVVEKTKRDKQDKDANKAKSLLDVITGE
ncbi:hypothetical protein [Vibrio panuliri]|uniref:Uncharacterized protein n=1 Tax=Vibrio panuliri TaxID=1381081 RepID=A0ABX3FFF3_9VIBR|nr:hypothetical protein [Vibrio panuliri]KAB1460884.1 hypothetical protein F7O85_00475 [Vibrio panuliri]OLQ91637.1 hypothetical protein BIY20_09550 [Vibrio panuliri]